MFKGRGPRDRHDVRLAAMVMTLSNAEPFRARNVFVRALEDRGLDEAFQACTITSSKEFGCFLSRMRGRHGAITIEPVPNRRWRARPLP
jgi:limonene-1,2-epoxide hydrolase